MGAEQNYSDIQKKPCSERELVHGRLARRAATEGMVLLRMKESFHFSLPRQ